MRTKEYCMKCGLPKINKTPYCSRCNRLKVKIEHKLDQERLVYCQNAECETNLSEHPVKDMVLKPHPILLDKKLLICKNCANKEPYAKL